VTKESGARSQHAGGGHYLLQGLAFDVFVDPQLVNTEDGQHHDADHSKRQHDGAVVWAFVLHT